MELARFTRASITDAVLRSVPFARSLRVEEDIGSARVVVAIGWARFIPFCSWFARRRALAVLVHHVAATIHVDVAIVGEFDKEIP